METLWSMTGDYVVVCWTYLAPLCAMCITNFFCLFGHIPSLTFDWAPKHVRDHNTHERARTHTTQTHTHTHTTLCILCQALMCMGLATLLLAGRSDGSATLRYLHTYTHILTYRHTYLLTYTHRLYIHQERHTHTYMQKFVYTKYIHTYLHTYIVYIWTNTQKHTGHTHAWCVFTYLQPNTLSL